MGELRCKECWQMFKDKISYSAFQKYGKVLLGKYNARDIY